MRTVCARLLAASVAALAPAVATAQLPNAPTAAGSEGLYLSCADMHGAGTTAMLGRSRGSGGGDQLRWTDGPMLLAIRERCAATAPTAALPEAPFRAAGVSTPTAALLCVLLI